MCVSVKCVQHRCAHEIHVITHVCIIQNVLMRYTPHQMLLGDGFSTPVPLFCLICTINPNKTGILD